ncbi:tRNA lysidine(34) synthetase TilS [Sulfurimonas sp.]|uniref:tRNA lysidine(34) synthetase TilS n=1 Tax=Sulfurimonas sp. TaxID=2022749 RepID=UPI0026063BD2|nr:tRNA lysidine(34) synthetase TilS [Sulfurimonas sp.]
MLTQTTKSDLTHTKNLLAFSAGGDSTALFFLLLEHKISFDIAIVDYGVREQSKKEVTYAQELAKQYNLKCYLHTAKIIKNNFEANARKIRYDFFEALIQEHGYDALLTAHHLGDRFEWMLMQFCKGAGCAELSGMKYKDKRGDYTLYRPLLHLDKQELLKYLHNKGIPYFEDESNEDEKYKRNIFRKNHTVPLLKEYLHGIKKSFAYLDEDVDELIQECELTSINQLAYFQDSHSKRSNIYTIDKYLKSLGHIITANERLFLKENRTLVVGRKYVITQTKSYIFIAPYIQASKMSKTFKERMRILQIDTKLRGYLALDSEAVALVSRLLQ